MDKNRRKQQIMEVALRQFASRGYHSTSVADTIREMEVARGTFYRYFRDRHDLFDQLLEDNFRYVKRVLPEVGDFRSLTAKEVESMLTLAFCELLSRPKSRDFVSVMVNEAAGADRMFAQKVEDFYDGLAEIFSAYISRAQEEGLIREHNAGISSHLVLGALKEIFIQRARGDKFSDLEELVRETVSFIIRGMGTMEKQ